MKKILMIFAAAVMLSSCVIDNNRTCHYADSYLESFSDDLVGRSAERCVRSFYGMMNDAEVNAEGFSMTMAFNDGMAVYVERIADGSWSMNCDKGKLQFSLRLNLIDTGSELSSWTCSSFAAAYDEGNGFTAVLASDGDILFDWVYAASGATWRLEQSGMYAIETYYEDSALDAGFLRYSHGERSFSSESLRR